MDEEPSFTPNPAAEFAARLHRSTPRLWVTPALIAANAAVFLTMCALGVDPLAPHTDDIVRWGGNFAPLTTHDEWWRLFTCMFVHIGLLHVTMNMVVLWDIGRFVERLLGNIGFLVVYLLAGLAGSVASLAWNSHVVSAGASGAIFGLYGALFGFLLRNRHAIPRGLLLRLRKAAGLFVIYNIAFSFAVRGIDIAAHLGGFSGGFLLGLAIALPLADEAVARRPRRNAAVGLAGLALIVGVASAIPARVDFVAEWEKAATLEARLDQAYQADLAKTQQGQLSGADFARDIRTSLLPAWQAKMTDLAGLQLTGQDNLVRRKLVEYMHAREREWLLTAESLTNDDPALAEALKAQSAECERFGRELSRMINEDR
ncbi:MAG: rhomboid family intramembrane serine protease [Verrucomicrobiota bacterium]|nr:rhomboid family intramembrane serine protease [Verrucomicrobiota bacterium]